MPLLSFNRSKGQPAPQKHPNTVSSYSYSFVSARPKFFLTDDFRPVDTILRERANLGQKLNNYLDARDAHRDQVAYNHAIYANQIGDYSLRQPQNRFGQDPGKDTAWTPPDPHEIPEYWPSQKSGMRIGYERLHDWADKFVHLNFTALNYEKTVNNISTVGSSIVPMNQPSKWLTSKEKSEYYTQRNVFSSDLCQTMMHELNTFLISKGSYVYFQTVRVSPYGYDEDLVAHFPESDVERQLWREHLMDIPRPADEFSGRAAATANDSSPYQAVEPLQSRNPFRKNALPSYDQVWKQG